MGSNKDKIDQLLQQILDNPRIVSMQSSAGSKVYEDEPIIRRASQMSSYMPQKIRQMRELQHRPDTVMWSDTHLFVEQARLMEDFADNCPYHGEYYHYFPSYRSMNDRQLRGYFTWRTHVREGNVAPTCPAFAFIYVYELLNGIGTKAGEKGFRDIEGFWQKWQLVNHELDRYVTTWLVDYAAWHGLDTQLAADYAGGSHDAAIEVLAAAEGRVCLGAAGGRKRVPYPFGKDPDGQRELFDALCELSSYDTRASSGFANHSEDYAAVCQAVFARLVKRWRGSHEQTYVESLFGKRYATVHHMFASSLFCFPTQPHADVEYQVTATTRYTCKNGRWSKNCYHDAGAKLEKIAQLMRAVDLRLCGEFGVDCAFADAGAPKYLTSIIDAETRDYLAWKKTSAPVRVDIDLSKLAAIRTAAASTREALLVDEEREDVEIDDEPSTEEEVEQVEAGAVPAVTTGETGDALPYGLTTQEARLLADLLDSKTPVASGLDLLVDSINEKLFDLLGDTALEFGDDGMPRVVEDYADDVRGALKY